MLMCPDCGTAMNPDRVVQLCRACGWKDPGHPMYRTNDPQTSVDAGEDHRSTAASHRKRIAAYVVDGGHDGLIRDEIALGTGLEPAQVWRRLPELESEGIIQASDAVTRISPLTGKRQRTWWIVNRADQSRMF